MLEGTRLIYDKINVCVTTRYFQPGIQKRLRAEIKEALIKSNGNLSYEDILNMQYLHMVVQGNALRIINLTTDLQ